MWKIRASTKRLLHQLAFNVLPDLLRALHPPSAGTGFKLDTHSCMTTLFIYGYITNSYDFKADTDYLSYCEPGVWIQLIWLLQLESHKAAIQGAHLEAGLGRVLSPLAWLLTTCRPSSLWQHCELWGACWLSAELAQSLGVTCIPCHT